MKIALYIFLMIYSLLLNSCDLLPAEKKMTPESRKIMDEIVKELRLENIKYGYSRIIKNGKDKLGFQVSLYDVDIKENKSDSINFEEINKKVFSVFEKSQFDFTKVDAFEFYYFTTYSEAKTIRCFYFDSNKHLQKVYID